MSAGGQRGIDVSGITGMRQQNASDVTRVLQLDLMYKNFASTTGANAFRNRTPNGYNNFLQFTQGRKEIAVGIGCSTVGSCSNRGLPYNYDVSMNFRT
jgi:hypothetical protein